VCDPKAIEFGTYMLREPRTGSLVIAEHSVGGYGLGLDDIQDYLERRFDRIRREAANRTNTPPPSASSTGSCTTAQPSSPTATANA